MDKSNDIKITPEAPPGLKSLINHCQEIYPDQPNPLQVQTLLKFWLGGQDPLDYISMYFNKGDASKDIPPHWHYISFGLSDLHGDARVHPISTENTRSGMGFELTFRLLCEDYQIESVKYRKPPTWPANLLQDIARYCFQTGNSLCVGDNIPWRKPLDVTSTSRLQHILLAEDPQLNTIETPFGTVDFCQIVGVTEDELEHASCWNGKGILKYLKQDFQTGGEWLVTDMKRKRSVFELFPETLLNLKDDLEKQGSDLAGINAEFTFREIHEKIFKQELEAEINEETHSFDMNIDTNSNSIDFNFTPSSASVDNSLEKSCHIYNNGQETKDCVLLDGIEITFAPYAVKFLLLAIKDRVRHGRHFTFKSQNSALTLVAESVTGSAVSKKSPYGVLGYWVQVLITEESIPGMILAFQDFLNNNDSKHTDWKEFDWPDINLKIYIKNT